MNPQQKAQRLPLFHAIAIALFAATSEQAFATELEQEAKARARVAEIVDQLPDLGSEPGTNKTAASLASTCLQIQEYAVARAALLLGAEDDDVATQQRFDASEQRDLPMWLAMIDRASATIAQSNHRITLH